MPSRPLDTFDDTSLDYLQTYALSFNSDHDLGKDDSCLGSISLGEEIWYGDHEGTEYEEGTCHFSPRTTWYSLLPTVEEETVAGDYGKMMQGSSLDGEENKDMLCAASSAKDSEWRFIRHALHGSAPFTKEHLIMSSVEAPFAGPHTAIRISLGLDRGKWFHIAGDLHDAEINLVDSAIYWLWPGACNDKGKAPEALITKACCDPIPHPVCRNQMIGPPEAPFRLTDSTAAPFRGPHTFIRNTGRRLDGWILHTPRFLTKNEIRIATQNLRHIGNRPYGWVALYDPVCNRNIKRTLKEETDLIALFQRQDWEMEFLNDIVGLDFAAQDHGPRESAPIWARHNSFWREPETVAMPCKASAATSKSARKDTPNIGVENATSYTRCSASWPPARRTHASVILYSLLALTLLVLHTFTLRYNYARLNDFETRTAHILTLRATQQAQH